MKTICAKVLVSLVFHVEDDENPDDVLNEMDYNFSLENGDPVNSAIVDQSFEIIEN